MQFVGVEVINRRDCTFKSEGREDEKRRWKSNGRIKW